MSGIEVKSGFVEVGTQRLFYQEAGQGQPVIMLHGGGPGASGGSNYAARNLGPLSRHFRVILIDQPGFGQSSLPVIDKPRCEVNADAVKGFMDAQSIDSATLVGNSMGGGAALYLALKYPERVRKLALMGTVFGASYMFGSFPPEGLKVVFAAFKDPTPPNLRAMYDAMLFDASSIDNSVLEARAADARNNKEQLDAFLDDIKRHIPISKDLTPELKNIRVPTLVLHGRNDRVVPYEMALRLVSDIPNSRLTVFNQCGHWVQYEKADEFNRLLADFVANVN